MQNILVAIAVFGFAFVAIAYVMQRSLLFPAPRHYSVGIPAGYSLISTRTDDGLSLKALFRPSANGKPTIVFFHGNGDDFAGADTATRAIAAMGFGVMLVEYRGYGGNPGSPDEAGLYHDGEAAMSWLAERSIGPRQIVLIGNSMGSGPATELALRHPVKGLVLISGFASLPGVVADLYPILPANLLIRDKFDSVSKLPRVTSPILLLHGEADDLVGAENSRRLAHANDQARLVIVPDTGHELAYRPVAQARILEWLSTL